MNGQNIISFRKSRFHLNPQMMEYLFLYQILKRGQNQLVFPIWSCANMRMCDSLSFLTRVKTNRTCPPLSLLTCHTHYLLSPMCPDKNYLFTLSSISQINVRFVPIKCANVLIRFIFRFKCAI